MRGSFGWLALVGVVGCNLGGGPLPDEVKYGGDVVEIHGGSGSVTEGDDGAVVIHLGLVSDPMCQAADDGLSVDLVIAVPDPSAIALGDAIDLSDPAAPVTVAPAVTCFCPAEDRTPVYTLTGSLTFDALSPTEAAGAIDLHLVGDVPTGIGAQVLEADSSLDVTWTFDAPFDDAACG
ncbi:MAG: hypothetical protein ABMB14_07180 [Myxococcota bacterium]